MMISWWSWYTRWTKMKIINIFSCLWENWLICIKLSRKKMWRKSPLHLPMLAATSANPGHTIKLLLNNFSKDLKMGISTSRNLSPIRKKLTSQDKYTNTLNFSKLKINSWWTATSSARKDWSKKSFSISKTTTPQNTPPSSKPKPTKKYKSMNLSSTTTTPKSKVSHSNNSLWCKEAKDISMSSSNLLSWKKCW